MIKFNIGKTRITLRFSFLAVVTLCVLLYDEIVIILSVLSCLLHELGHIIAIRAFGIEISDICLYGGGMKIKYEQKLLPASKELIIALSGALVNFFICLLSVCDMGTLFDVNLALGIFNLLPLGYLDGKRAIDILMKKYLRLRPIFIFFKVVSMLLVLAVLAYAVFFGKVNLSVYVTVAFLIISEALIHIGT